MRRPKTYVIDQDEHLQNLRKIIKRDFFQNSPIQATPQDQAIPLSLNNYIKNFKSQQNHIFAQLVHGDAEQWRQKHEWMQKTKQFAIQSASKIQSITDKPFTNMLGKNPNIKAIDYSITKQEPINAVFFAHSGRTQSYNDVQYDRVKNINYGNCRIQEEEVQRAKIYKMRNILDPNLEQIPSTPILDGRRQIKGHNNKFDNFQQKSYSVKRIPSPQPQKIPIMTWGQIQSTPMRIPNTPYRNNKYQQSYKLPQQPASDKLLQKLNAKIVKQKLIKKQKKQDLKIKILSSMRPSSNNGGSVLSGSSYRKISMARQNSIKRDQVNNIDHKAEGNNGNINIDKIKDKNKKFDIFDDLLASRK